MSRCSLIPTVVAAVYLLEKPTIATILVVVVDIYGSCHPYYHKCPQQLVPSCQDTVPICPDSNLNAESIYRPWG